MTPINFRPRIAVIVTIDVTPVNDPPTLSGIPDVTFAEDGSDSSIDLDNYYGDVETPAGSASFTVQSSFSGVAVSIDGGIRVVAVSTARGAIRKAGGLDVEALVGRAREVGSRVVESFDGDADARNTLLERLQGELLELRMVPVRTLFGRLRAIGVTPRELFSLILLEAAILAVLGTSIGLVLGIWLGQGLTRLVAATVSELYYNVSVTALHLDTGSLLVAIALGVLATLVATLVPAWHAARTPPLTTLSRAALEQSARHAVPLWGLSGLALLLIGLLLALVLPGDVIMSFAGLFLLVLGAAMMTPMIIRLLHRLLARAAPPGIWRMGVRDLDRHLSRLGIAVAALMVALSASVGVGVMVESMRGSVNTWLGDLLSADLYVAAEGFDQEGQEGAAAAAEGRNLGVPVDEAGQAILVR